MVTITICAIVALFIPSPIMIYLQAPILYLLTVRLPFYIKFLK